MPLLKSVVSLTLATLCLSIESLSQTPTYIPVRNATALAKIQQTLSAMGGIAAVAGVRTILAKGTVSPVTGSAVKAGTFAWTTQISASGVEFRREFESGGATWITVSGHGHPQIGRGNKRQKLLEHATATMLPFHVPAVVLAMMNADATNSIQLKGNSAVNGVMCLHLQITNASDPIKDSIAKQDWYLDLVTGLPLRVEYRVPSSVDPSDYSVGAEEFYSYSTIGGIAVPLKIKSFEQGNLVSVTTITSVQMNPTVSDSDFDLPEAN